MNRQILRVFLVLSAAQAFALEPNYTLPPITNMTPASTMQRARDRGCRLMSLKGIPDGDVTLVCTNWICPTSIVVNAVRYDIATNIWDDEVKFSVVTTNVPSETIARGSVEKKENGFEARLSAFMDMSFTSMQLDVYALGVVVQPLDSPTNMMFLTNIGNSPRQWHHLAYKDMHLRYHVMRTAYSSPATNALAFAAAIINAGLPENERIPLPPTP